MDSKAILKDYEEIPKTAVIASKVVSDMWIKLGRPQTPFTESGKKMMDIIIAVWQDCFPIDAETWYAERRNYKLNELSIGEQVKRHTGRSLASYPYEIYQLMKVTFKGFDSTERKNCMRMCRLWPMFQFANRV